MKFDRSWSNYAQIFFVLKLVSLLHFVFVVIFVFESLANHNTDCYKSLTLNIPGTGQQSLFHLMSNTFLCIVYSLYHGILASSFQLFVHSLIMASGNVHLVIARYQIQQIHLTSWETFH